ncbi:MAG: hypothetical protein H7249_05470 [Chitinophagaceae bacterium]|nr:hypothetical protein [Oligoflexus sp.]
MKTILGGLVLSLISLTHAYAGASQSYPFLTRTMATGFVAPDYRRVETCEIYKDHVVITKVFGTANPLTSVETKQTSLSGDFDTLLQAAAGTQTVTEPTGTADAGSSGYTATWKKADTRVLIILKTDDGLTRVTNPSVAASLLTNVIDGICPSAFQ